MASLLSQNDINFFTGFYQKHFDTFTYNRTKLITIHKEPLRTRISSPTNPAYGYGEDANPENFTYTIVTGIYPAVISYSNDQKQSELEEIKNSVPIGRTRIKVEEACKNFIEDGRKTEKITFDNKSFNTITFDSVHHYLGLKYYIYFLENTI